MRQKIEKSMNKQHQYISRLLPWYVTGHLSLDDHAAVEAHLAICPDCTGDLKSERRLAAHVAALEIDVDEGWTRLRAQLGPGYGDRFDSLEDLSKPPPLKSASPWVVSGAKGWTSWAIATQSLFIIIGAIFLFRPGPTPIHVYHTLGAAPSDRSANVMVIFRPDASERRIRSILRAGDARLVDGPTESDAYVLHIPPHERDGALLKLRKAPEIEIAEPIDAGS